MTERIEKGIETTLDAINNEDALAIKRCLDQFKKIQAPAEQIQKAIECCPLDLLKKTGYCVKIHSNLLGKEVVIGQDVSFKAVKDLIKVKPKKEELQLIFEAATLFGGCVEESKQEGK